MRSKLHVALLLVQRLRQMTRPLMAVLAKLPRRSARVLFPMATTASLCLLLAPLLPLIHQAAVLAIAISLRATASSLLVKNFLIWVGFDPVYASVFNRTLGNIEAQGLAVAGPLGQAFHQLVPQLFAPPAQTLPGAWATALVGDGASLLASAIAMVGTEVIFIAAGLALLRAGLRSGRATTKAPFLALTLVGLMLQARGVVGLLGLRFSLEDIEIMGLSHLFTKLFPVGAESYRGLVVEPFRALAPYVVPSLLIFAIYGVALAPVLLKTWSQWRWHTKGWLALRPALRWLWPLEGQKLGHTALVAVALFVGAALSQGLFPALPNYNYAAEVEEAPISILEGPAPSLAPQEEAPIAKEALKAGPSKVVISGAEYAYSYMVNGRPEKIQGVGYNPRYSHLSPAERAARYDRDFAQMKAAGVNTILGWEREQFDELVLDKAQEYGLGVVMPYYLSRDGDYANPAYQQAVEQDVKGWVRRFQKYRALRMWGIGNEVIHGMGRNPDTPQARAFAQFYVRLADEVHATDPDHPVIYRDAEDLYLGPLRDAFQKGGGRRPWFVYGVNFFTLRICEALQDWPKKRMDVPLIVSEFAPSGLRPEDRPKGYLRMLECIEKNRPSVLGGFAYVWSTSGPEAIDRVMGLVDDEGRPVDHSLSVLGKAFHHDNQGAPEGVNAPSQSYGEAGTKPQVGPK